MTSYVLKKKTKLKRFWFYCWISNYIEGDKNKSGREKTTYGTEQQEELHWLNDKSVDACHDDDGREEVF